MPTGTLAPSALQASPLYALIQSPLKALNGNQVLGLPGLEYRYAFINRVALGFRSLNPDPTDPLGLDIYRRWKNLTFQEVEFGPPGPPAYDHTFVSSTGGGNVPVSNLPNDPSVISDPGEPDDGNFEDPTPVAANSPAPGGTPPAQDMTQTDGMGTVDHSKNNDVDGDFISGFLECTLDTEWDYTSLIADMSGRLVAEDFTVLWNDKIDRNIWYDEFPTVRTGTAFGINLETTVVIADIDTGYTGGERTNTQAANPAGGDGRGSNFDLFNVPGSGSIKGNYGVNHLLLSRVQIRAINFPAEGKKITVYETAGGFLLVRDQFILMPGVIYELPMPSFGSLAVSGPYPNGQSFLTLESSVQAAIGDAPGGFTVVTEWL